MLGRYTAPQSEIGNVNVPVFEQHHREPAETIRRRIRQMMVKLLKRGVSSLCRFAPNQAGECLRIADANGRQSIDVGNREVQHYRTAFAKLIRVRVPTRMQRKNPG